MSIVTKVVVKENFKIITTVFESLLTFHPVLADLARQEGATRKILTTRTVREEIPEVSDVPEIGIGMSKQISKTLEKPFVPLSGLLELIPKGRSKA